MATCSNLHDLKPALLMVLVQIVYSLVNICYKLAAHDGMNISILVGYRFLFAAAFILPLAFFAERKKRPKLTRKIALYGFLCGLFGGSLGQNLYLQSLVLTSATFVSAMTNLVPAVTFIVAISLRLERLGWNSAAGKAKVLGTMLGIGGAMIITFYKGMELNIWNTHINLLATTATHRHHDSGLETESEHGSHKFILGAVLALASCLCYSLWLIIQAKVVEQYPCPYSITAMMAVAASFQGVAFALCIERDWSQWNLGWDIRLFTVAVTGILGSSLVYSLVAWGVRTRGPLFVSIFQPLMLVMVAIGGSLFLEEKLHLGMVIGAILIVGGLYFVLWGKRKEIKNASDLTQENTENEARIDMPTPPPSSLSPPSQIGSNHSSSGSRAEVEEEGRIDLPWSLPPQNDINSHSSSGNMKEAEMAEKVEEQEEVEAQIDMLSRLQNSSSRSSSGIIKEAETEVEVEKHADAQIDMLLPLQNSSSHSSSGNMKEAEVE